MENPFITNGYAGSEYFCDREKETADIVSLLTNGNNIALISPRRYGKTDLIRHCFAQPDIQQRYYTFVIDIFATRSVADFVATMGSGILEALKPKGKKVWEHFLAAVSSVKSDISFDMNGLPVWSMSVGDIKSPQTTLDEIFKYIRNADRRCLIAIDEFQQITQYGDNNIEALLRTHVQYCPNANFVFSGSQQHIMGSMFTSPARPFYQSVTLYNLPTIPLEKYRDFCVHHFSLRNRRLDPCVVDQLYATFDGVTYYMQRMMNELYANTLPGASCTPSDIEPALQHILDISASIYEDLLYQLPEKQCRVLLAIAAEGKATNLTSGKFAKKYGLLSPSSVKSAVPALLDRGLLANEKGVYQVYDRFLLLWLAKRKMMI